MSMTYKVRSPGHVFLGDVGHFNTSLHVWQLFDKHMFNIRRECPSSSKKLALIPCKSSWILLSKDTLRKDEGTEGCP
jgi:hypothetical protein